MTRGGGCDPDDDSGAASSAKLIGLKFELLLHGSAFFRLRGPNCRSFDFVPARRDSAQDDSDIYVANLGYLTAGNPASAIAISSAGYS